MREEVKQQLIESIDVMSSEIEDAIKNDEFGLDNIQAHCSKILRKRLLGE